MATTTMNQLRSRMDRIDAGTVLVRGTSAPPRPSATVTVAPGVVARATPDRRFGALYVTAEAPCGRTSRRYDGSDADAVGDYAEELIADRDPQSVWLCDRGRVAARSGEDAARALERRLAAAARRADTRLVVWTTAEDGAVADRYDVVLDA